LSFISFSKRKNNSGAETIFGRRGGREEARPKAPKSGTRRKESSLELERFLSRKNERSPKKRSSLDLERFFFVPKIAQDTGLRGGKIRPGEATYFPRL